MAATQTTTPAARVAFDYPSFGLYQIARFCIVLATEMQSVAVGWQVYEITKRPLDLGLVGLAQFLPGILLFLVSGHVADRYDRRRLVVTMSTAPPTPAPVTPTAAPPTAPAAAMAMHPERRKTAANTAAIVRFIETVPTSV